MPSTLEKVPINSQERQAVITSDLARARAIVLHLGCAEKLWGDLVKCRLLYSPALLTQKTMGGAPDTAFLIISLQVVFMWVVPLGDSFEIHWAGPVDYMVIKTGEAEIQAK